MEPTTPSDHSYTAAPGDAPVTVSALPPVAAKLPVTRSFHGRDLQDDYEWLRDKENPEVRAHLEAENAWTESRTSHLKPL